MALGFGVEGGRERETRICPPCSTSIVGSAEGVSWLGLQSEMDPHSDAGYLTEEIWNLAWVPVIAQLLFANDTEIFKLHQRMLSHRTSSVIDNVFV